MGDADILVVLARVGLRRAALAPVEQHADSLHARGVRRADCPSEFFLAGRSAINLGCTHWLKGRIASGDRYCEVV
jgi:hypothetical protein